MWCPDRWQALSSFLQNHFDRARGQGRHWQQDTALGPAVDLAAGDFAPARAEHETSSHRPVHTELEPIEPASGSDHLRHDPGKCLSLHADGLCRSALLALKIGKDCAADCAAFCPAPAGRLDRAEQVARSVESRIGTAAEIVDPRALGARIADEM